MTFDSSGFRSFFVNVVGAAAGTANTYNSFLGRIDGALGGLDEAIARDGADRILTWSRETKESPFDVYASSARSVLKRYLGYKTNSPELSEEAAAAEVTQDVTDNPTSSIFSVEREMQAAVRRQLARVEPGLTEADGGIEKHVATGRIDILARDAAGTYVVVELKAGRCPPGAMEQALGYAQALQDEVGEPVRAILVAAEFSDRVLAAAKRVRDLKLVEYEYSLAFSEASNE